MEKPKVIFLDAVGTLFGIRGSVGEVYSAIAARAGVEADPQRLNEAFIQSFKASPASAFPGVAPEQIPEQEFQWWEAIAKSTFERVGVFEYLDWNTFFNKLYLHFATDEPWFVYADVFPTLERWRQQGTELGIISNFDTRLAKVLESLELEEFFSSVTVSSTAGAAKPNRHIFLAALEKHKCIANQAWHIGDSEKEDYDGAQAAGLRAFLLQRPRVTLEQIAHC